MREEHDEATRHSLRTRHCRCGFSETYEQTRVGRGAERAPHVLLLCQVDVSELCARLSPVEWSGLNYASIWLAICTAYALSVCRRGCSFTRYSLQC